MEKFIFRQAAVLAGAVSMMSVLAACGPSVPVGVWELSDNSRGLNLTCPISQFEIRRDSIVIMGVAQDIQYRSRGGRTEAVNRQAGVSVMSFQNRGGDLYVEHAGVAALSGLLGGREADPCRYRRVRR